MDQNIERQEVLWVPENRQVSVEGELNGRTVRIWSLYNHTDPNQKPDLPYTPVHHGNAFLEDYIHDWNHRQGILRYYSRAIFSNLWILVEFKTPRKK
jgi:hypothetical protein